MPSIQSAAVPEDIAAVLSALGNPAGARVVRELAANHEARTVPELAAIVGQTRAATHNRVAALEAIGVVRSDAPEGELRGRVVRWVLDQDGLSAAVDRMRGYLNGR